MKKSDSELMELADAVEHWSDTADLDAIQVDRLDDLVAVGKAAEVRDKASAMLTSAVATARGNGRSWAEIAVRLGVSRQAALKKYSPLVHDAENGSIAARRLADISAGRSQTVSAEEVARDLGL